MDHTILDPQQIQQLIDVLQEISSKLDALQSSNSTDLNQLADKIMDNLLSYHFITGR